MMYVLFVTSFVAAADVSSHDLGLLSQRVSEDLLREGVALGRLGLSLRVAKAADGTEVALVQDGAVVQARVLAELPADFEAAVSQLTTVVNVLLRQVKWAAPSSGGAEEAPAKAAKSDEARRLEKKRDLLLMMPVGPEEQSKTGLIVGTAVTGSVSTLAALVPLLENNNDSKTPTYLGGAVAGLSSLASIYSVATDKRRAAFGLLFAGTHVGLGLSVLTYYQTPRTYEYGRLRFEGGTYPGALLASGTLFATGAAYAALAFKLPECDPQEAVRVARGYAADDPQFPEAVARAERCLVATVPWWLPAAPMVAGSLAGFVLSGATSELEKTKSDGYLFAGMSLLVLSMAPVSAALIQALMPSYADKLKENGLELEAGVNPLNPGISINGRF